MTAANVDEALPRSLVTANDMPGTINATSLVLPTRLLIALGICLVMALFGTIGVVSPFVHRFIGIVLLGAIGLVSMPTARSLLLALAGAAVAFMLASLTSDPTIWAFLWAGTLAWYAQCAAQAEVQAWSYAWLSTLARAAMYASVLLALYRHVPAVWTTLQSLSVATSRALSGVGGGHVSLGVEASGLDIALVFICICLAFAHGARDQSGKLTAWFAVAATLIIYSGYQLLGVLYAPLWVEQLMAWGQGKSINELGNVNPAMLFLHAPMVLLITFLVLGTFLFSSIHIRQPIHAQRKVKSWWLVAAVCGLLLAWHPAARPANGKVVFHNVGMLNWDVPILGRYGIQSAGMFGMLPRYLLAAGFDTDRLGKEQEISDAVLDEASVLVVTNPTETFSAEAHAAIWRFVERGGSLLVLGDHTDISNTMEPLNTLLAPSGISFAFDSAFTIRNWNGDYDFAVHPVTRRLTWTNDYLQHSTGASLNLGGSARPVVTAKFAFSDAGVRENEGNGFLGDYRYQTTEQLAGLPIVAEAVIGAGKVLVFGDTSAFQNPAISHSALFLADVFAYLDAPEALISPFWRDVLQVLALGLLLLFVYFLSLHGRRLAVGLFALAGVAVVTELILDAQLEIPFTAERVALIDGAHVNRFSLKHWEKDSVGGLSVNLMRAGYLPVLVREGQLDSLPSAPLMFSLAPAKAPGAKERKRLRSFMENGGFVVLGVGWEEHHGVKAWLSDYGLEISPIPLGPVPVLQKTSDQQKLIAMQSEPHFLEAWPIKATPKLDQVLYTTGEHDVVGLRRVGKGGMVLIADSKFLLDRTLEDENAWWAGNVQFVRDLFLELKRIRTVQL